MLQWSNQGQWGEKNVTHTGKINIFVLAEGLDMFKIGSIAASGRLLQQATCSYEEIFVLMDVSLMNPEVLELLSL
jgi:hypothetical protein